MSNISNINSKINELVQHFKQLPTPNKVIDIKVYTRIYNDRNFNFEIQLTNHLRQLGLFSNQFVINYEYNPNLSGEAEFSVFNITENSYTFSTSSTNSQHDYSLPQERLLGPYVIPQNILDKFGTPESPINQPLYGDGECPVLPQMLIRMPTTPSWREGEKAFENSNVLKGTVIATFYEGRYKSAASGSEEYERIGGNHAAIFLRNDTYLGEKGFYVIDQWDKKKTGASIRFIYADAKRKNSNNAYAFSVVLSVQPAPKRPKRRK